MLSATGLTKRYGDVAALDDVEFDLAAGEVLAVIGANGAGKTTLIKCLMGLVKFEGTVTVDGIDVARNGPAARRKVGYLPQSPAFHTDLTVAETALFYADLKRVPAGRARSLVDSVGLGEHAAKKVGALSGGMRQRLSLAVALLAEPMLLVFDEPVAGLDMPARLELRRLVLEQRDSGRAVVLSTHWLEDVPYIADRVLALDRGKCAFLGPASESVAATSPVSRLYLRLNGHTPDAIGIIQQAAPAGAIARSGDWVVVRCKGPDKAMVVERLLASGIGVLDFRVEEAPDETASSFHDLTHEVDIR
ncbi:MAG: ABC transporter ATP-binding protein [Dehalococcoidia bacterium]